MRFAIAVLLGIWLLCGVVGAWMLDDLDVQHWKVIAKGPITLAKAVNEYDGQSPWS